MVMGPAGWKRQRRVTVLTVYRVVKGTATAAEERSAWMQQWLLLRMQGRNEEPRAALPKDLREILWEHNATAYIVVGDLNS